MVAMLFAGGCTHHRQAKVDPAVTRLDAAVGRVSDTRAAVLSAVDAVQAAASQLDRTDELCAQGNGTRARASFRTALPLTRRAGAVVTGFAALVISYSQALDAFGSASRDPVVRARERPALTAVVADGRLEAAALEGFRVSLSRTWPVYDRLSAEEDVWSSHAVSGWYRTTQEAAAAYSVLVSPGRSALEQARGRLASAAAALDGPIARQRATLQAADRVLQPRRTG